MFPETRGCRGTRTKPGNLPEVLAREAGPFPAPHWPAAAPGAEEAPDTPPLPARPPARHGGSPAGRPWRFPQLPVTHPGSLLAPSGTALGRRGGRHGHGPGPGPPPFPGGGLLMGSGGENTSASPRSRGRGRLPQARLSSAQLSSAAGNGHAGRSSPLHSPARSARPFLHLLGRARLPHPLRRRQWETLAAGTDPSRPCSASRGAEAAGGGLGGEWAGLYNRAGAAAFVPEGLPPCQGLGEPGCWSLLPNSK